MLIRARKFSKITPRPAYEYGKNNRNTLLFPKIPLVREIGQVEIVRVLLQYNRNYIIIDTEC